MDFMHSWISLFSHSPKTRLLWKSWVGRSKATYSSIRWWSKLEVVKMVTLYFGEFVPFLRQKDNIGPATRPKLLSFFASQQKIALLQIWIHVAVTVDWGEPFIMACYFLKVHWLLSIWTYQERVCCCAYGPRPKCTRNCTIAVRCTTATPTPPAIASLWKELLNQDLITLKGSWEAAWRLHWQLLEVCECFLLRKSISCSHMHYTRAVTWCYFLLEYRKG